MYSAEGGRYSRTHRDSETSGLDSAGSETLDTSNRCLWKLADMVTVLELGMHEALCDFVTYS